MASSRVKTHPKAEAESLGKYHESDPSENRLRCHEVSPKGGFDVLVRVRAGNKHRLELRRSDEDPLLEQAMKVASILLNV